jgi:hypothetical protein
VKTDPDFLCGTEFDTLGSELAFFRRHGLEVEDVQIDIVLRPGHLLVFDNLMFAHGRRDSVSRVNCINEYSVTSE